MQLWQKTARTLDGQMEPQVKLQAQVIVWLRLDFDYTLHSLQFTFPILEDHIFLHVHAL